MKSYLLPSKFAAFTLLSILFILAVGCSFSESGIIVEKKFDISDFNKIEASDGFKIQINQGASYSVSVSTNDNILKDLVVTREVDTLKLEMSHSKGSKTTSTLKAEVTMPELVGLFLNDGASAIAIGSGQEIVIEMDTGSYADFSAFQVNDAYVSVNNGSQITVNAINNLDAIANNGSKIYYLGNPESLSKDASTAGTIAPVSK